MLHDRLRAVPLFAALSDEKLDWLTRHGEEIRLGAGEVVLTQGAPADHFWVVLAGEARFTVANNGQETIFLTHGPGEFFAEAPILMGKPYLGTGHAVRPSHFYRLPVSHFWEMLARVPAVARAIFSATTERVYQYQSMLQQQEKLAALGRLSAGIAHELNNPAAAARRAAEQLAQALEGREELALRLNLCSLDKAQRTTLAALRREAVARAAAAPPLNPLERSDREEAIADWLTRRQIAEGWRLAATFVVAGIDEAWLDHLAALLPSEALAEALGWLEASLASSQLLDEIGVSSARISELVRAVKSYTYMDQAPEQEVDIHEGLESTLVMMHHKLKRGVEVIRNYEPGLPRVTAYGGELNQVWTNLIDNAIDAMGGDGRLWVRTACEGDLVLVEICDDGPGIPPDIQTRIWEPFFTTKGVGEGSGLGLDIVYRIVSQRHRGDVRVASAPGDTRFAVRLPIRRTG